MSQTPNSSTSRVLASGLISRDQLADCENSLGGSANEERLLDLLVERRLLTKWQAQQIKAGRTTGFFLEHYKLLSLLGAGGMGQVFRAEDTQLGRQVAVKVLPRRRATAEMVQRFRREALAALRVQHENIVRTFELGQHDNTHFLVMELVEGTDLHQYIRKQGKLSVRDTARIGCEVARALEHARERGIIHRDIKPSNILLTRKAQAKLADLGLARFFGPRGDTPATMTRTGALMGTLDYLAPEQAEDAKQADSRSDIYSLGCTLYHCLAGRAPFAEGTDVQKIVAHRERDPEPIADLNPEVPPGLADVIHRRLLAKNPDERFQTPSEAAAALDRWSGEGDGDLSLLDVLLEEEAEAEATERPPSTEPPRKPKTKRSRPRRSSLTRRPSDLRRSSPRRRRPEVLLVPLGLMAILGLVLAWTFGPWKGQSSSLETTAPTTATIETSNTAPKASIAKPAGPDSKAALARLSPAPAEELPVAEGAPAEPTDAGTASGDWVSLFNGRNLTGWHGALRHWKVQDGALVGELRGNVRGNSYLVAEGEYSDFELRLRYKLDNVGNSGVQFRSQEGANGRLIGYQAEIGYLPNKARELKVITGDLYEELMSRGWIAKTTSQARRRLENSIPKDRWNDLRITAVGDHVTIEVNGVKTVDLHDRPGRKSGVVALQLHVGPFKPRIAFKDIRILPLDPSRGSASEAGAADRTAADLPPRSDTPATQADGEMQLVNLSKINTPEHESDVWPSPSGLRLYWSKLRAGESWVYSAARSNPGQSFEQPMRRIRGRMPSLTGDELEIALLVPVASGNPAKRPSGAKELIHFATRQSATGRFGPPRVSERLRGLTAGWKPAKAPSFSPDGLTLYLMSYHEEQRGAWRQLISRSSRNAAWGEPDPLPMTMLDPEMDRYLTWPYVSGDGRWLFCSQEGREGGRGALMVWHRSDPASPFNEFALIKVPGRGQLFGRSPRYVAATRELFFAAPHDLSDQRTWGKSENWDIWVVKNFTPEKILIPHNPVPSEPVAGNWIELFNGRDLSGWQVVGRANAWKVNRGILTCTGEPGGWLSTKETYDDFVLSLEYRLAANGNSGIFLRAPRQGRPAIDSVEVALLDDRAPRYARIKPEQYSGALYGVLAPSERVPRPAGQWNKMEILAQGGRVEVTVNSTRLTNADLDRLAQNNREHAGLKRRRGYIGLQNHRSKVEFRNLRLRELDTAADATSSPDAGWESLFNGSDLEGWTVMRATTVREFTPASDASGWEVRNGELISTDAEGSVLRSNVAYEDFVFRMEYKLPDDKNTAIYARAPATGLPWKSGINVQIIDNNYTGRELPPNRRNGAILGVVAPDRDVHCPVGEWNEIEVRCEGDRIRISLNGVLVVDADAQQHESLRDVPRSGFLCLSNVRGLATGTAYRNLRIQVLGETNVTDNTQP